VVSTPVVALVGSEGGWTDQEIAEAGAAGWGIVTLGGRILRAETAAIVVVVLLQHLAGDLT
jgi:16S rRNA (uracil1498-N3)-methyltransferase